MLTEIPSREISSGACGLILWTAGDTPKPVFLSETTGRSFVAVDGETVSLAITAASGEAFFGRRAEQTFRGVDAAGRQIEVRTSVERDSGFADGAYVSNGALRLVDDSGWEVIAPVVGLVGCRR